MKYFSKNLIVSKRDKNGNPIFERYDPIKAEEELIVNFGSWTILGIVNSIFPDCKGGDKHGKKSNSKAKSSTSKVYQNGKGKSS